MRKGKDKYTRDIRLFMGGYQGIGLELIGAYNVLIDLLYLYDGEIVRDDGHLAGIIGCSKRKARIVTDQLIELGKIQENRNVLTNKKTTERISRAKKISSSRKNQRWKSRENRPTLNENNDLKNVLLAQNGSARAREIDNTQIIKPLDTPPPTPPRAPQSARGECDPLRPWQHQIPADAEITDDQKKFALDKSMTLGEIEEQFERFKNHHRSKANFKQDWNAAWRLWVTDPIRKRENGKTQPDNRSDPRAYLEAARQAMPGRE